MLLVDRGTRVVLLYLNNCAGRAVKAGVTTDEIDRVVYEACMERYASASWDLVIYSCGYIYQTMVLTYHFKYT
jgi:hypothetical protein